MKIRIQGNSVRMRLSRTEVETLCKKGNIEETTNFGNKSFVYAVRRDSLLEELAASFNGHCITLFVPASFLENWAENNVIGLDAKMTASSNESLYLLLEKDFKCLDTSEDQSDQYENPNKTC